jgi:hypothetical protein
MSQAMVAAGMLPQNLNVRNLPLGGAFARCVGRLRKLIFDCFGPRKDDDAIASGL